MQLSSGEINELNSSVFPFIASPRFSGGRYLPFSNSLFQISSQII